MSKPPDRGPRPFTGWQWMWRGCFGVEIDGHRYDIEIDYFDFDERIWLYVDGELQGNKKTRGTWPVGDGHTLEAELQLFGMRRARLRTADGELVPLKPAPGSSEDWRQRMHDRHPTGSRVASACSLTVLIVALVLAVPQWISIGLAFFDIEWSWFELPTAVTTALSVLGILAGLERALRLRRESFS